MTLLWVITGTALVAALVAWSRSRRTAKRLEQLAEMYWELKYQHGELRSRLQRLTGETPPAPPSPAPGPPTEAFVPLASLALHRAGVQGGDPAPAPHRASVRGGDPAPAPHRAGVRGGDPAPAPHRAGVRGGDPAQKR